MSRSAREYCTVGAHTAGQKTSVSTTRRLRNEALISFTMEVVRRGYREEEGDCDYFTSTMAELLERSVTRVGEVSPIPCAGHILCLCSRAVCHSPVWYVTKNHNRGQ